MMATMAEAHREWHVNAGVPMGTPGCPQDACHPPEPYCYHCCDWPDATLPDLTAEGTCPECGLAAEVFGCDTCGQEKPSHPNDWHACDVTRNGVLMATPNSCAECRNATDW